MKRTVLLVDDEPVILKLYKDYFEYQGFRVLTAKHALDAVETVSHQHIDALITDMRMPGVNGQELIECLREKRPQLAAIIVSGYTRDFTMEIDDITKVFSKPVSLTRLTKCLQRMLNQENAHDNAHDNVQQAKTSRT